MAFADTARLITELVLNDKMTPGLNTAKGRLDQLQRSGEQLGKGIRQVGTGFTQLGTRAAVVAAGGLTAVVKLAGDFEAQLNTINTVARVSDGALAGIGDQIRALARDSGASLSDLTSAYYDLVSAGVDAADAQQVLTDANTLAIGGLATTAESVDLLTTAMNSYGLTADQVTVVTDQFAQAIAAGKVTAADLAGSFAQVAPIAASSKIEIDELAAAYGELTAQGVPAAEASTQIRSAIVALTRTTKPLEDLQKATGKTYLNIAGEKGLVVALQEMRTDAAKAGIPLIDLLGRVEGLNFTLGTTGPNFKAYQAGLDAVRKSSGLAAEQMAERQQGLNFQLGRLKALATDAGITIGNALLPALTDVANELGEFINKPETQRRIKEFAENLAQGARDLVKAFKAGEFQPFIDTLKGAAGVAKLAFDAFNALPGPIKQVVIASAIANRATGGAVGLIASGAANIFKGLLGLGGGLLSRGSSPANALWVQSVAGGVGGPGGPTLAPGGGIGRFITGLLGGALVFTEAEHGVQLLGELNKNVQEGNDEQARQNALVLAGGPASIIGDAIAKALGIDTSLNGLTGGRDRKEGAATPIGQFNPLNKGGTVPVKVTNANDLIDPVVFRELGAKITKKEEQVRSEVKQGDLAAARRHEREIEALHQARGSIRQGFTDVIPHLGRTNRALSVANRNLDDGNRRQRETAQRIAEARDRIGSGFREQNEIGRGILRKPTSFTANIQTNVTAYLSATQALQVINTYQSIRHSSDTSTNTGGSV